MSRPITVIKLGGSLLDWPGWPSRLTQLIATRAKARVVLVVGGGKFADALRHLDKVHTLGDARSHALALRVLDATAEVAAAILPGSKVVEEVADLPRVWEMGLIPILAPRRFMDQDDRSVDPLPHAWTTTTDSIAARLAVRLGAVEFIHCQSTPCPPEVQSWQAAADSGLVDPECPHGVEKIPETRLICLRNNDTVDVPRSPKLPDDVSYDDS